MRRLLPSLRPRKRYMAFELISEEPVSRGDLNREIFFSACSLLGDVLASECEIQLLGFEKQKGVIHCAHTNVRITRAALAAITYISGKRATVHVLGVSGTVKGATEKYLEKLEVFTPKKLESK